MVMCDVRWTLGVLLVAALLVAWLVHRLLWHQAQGSAITAAIVAKLRRKAFTPSDYPAAMTARELARQVDVDQQLRKRVDRQDFELLQRALTQQFWLAVGVYAGATILVAVGIFTLLEFKPRPPRITDWELRSDTPEAEGRAVDTDDLMLTWKSTGCAEDVELWLENVQTGRAIPTQHTSSAQQTLRLPTGTYRELLGSRALNGANRVRALAKTAGGTTMSQEWDLYVGVTVMIFTDNADYVYVSSLIDKSTAELPRHAVEGALITWNQFPQSGGGGVGTKIEEGFFKNPAAKVPLPKKLSADEWRRLAFAYYGEDGWRVRQTKQLPLELTDQKLLK
jgi:hypothetical protein